MKKYDYIFFDLDGTITDPGEGITNSVAYALKKFGIENTDRSELYPFIGPPLYASFMKYYGFSAEQAHTAVGYYREYYTDKGIFENRLYEGVGELLEKLQKSGKKIILATSKPEIFAKKILHHFNIDKYFHHIAGATLDSNRIEKADVIRYAFEKIGIGEGCGVMIGDRNFDIIGAKQTGLVSVGVLWGYGDKDELKGAGADFIAGTIKDLEEFLF